MTEQVEMEAPILITGAARSGTSMTAGIIHQCGAFGGTMSGPTPSNRRGMFENAVIRNGIVKPYLANVLNVDPMGQYPLPDISRLVRMPGLRKSIENIMWKQGYTGGPWFYKGAKMCLFWPVWHEAFPNAKWIIIRREDADVVNSCMRTGFMRRHRDPESWQGWLDEHKIRFGEMIAAGLQVREVWPSRFISGDFRSIKDTVENYCGLKWNAGAVSRFVEPALWRAWHDAAKRRDEDGASN